MSGSSRGYSCTRRCRLRERCSYDREKSRELQRHRSSSANVSEIADGRTASVRLRVPIGVGLRVEGLVGTDVADHSRALVREASKREGFAHLEDLLAVHLVTQDRIAGRVSSCAVCRCERLVCAEQSVHSLVEDCASTGVSPREVCRRRSAGCPLGCAARVGTELGTCGYSPSRRPGTTDGPT